jgi:hypothetical protein
MREFSLRKLACEAWDDLGSCDYHVLAKEIHRRIAAKDRDAALAEALVAYAREFNSMRRPTARKTAAGQKNSARSWKVQGVRREWPQLRARYWTGGDDRKPLGDCTAAEVVFIAENLDKKARENTRKAAWMRDLAGELAAHKAGRVRDLPDEVLATFLTGEAAA